MNEAVWPPLSSCQSSWFKMCNLQPLPAHKLTVSLAVLPVSLDSTASLLATQGRTTVTNDTKLNWPSILKIVPLWLLLSWTSFSASSHFLTSTLVTHAGWTQHSSPNAPGKRCQIMPLFSTVSMGFTFLIQ